jgi:hypothetical protein
MKRLVKVGMNIPFFALSTSGCGLWWSVTEQRLTEFS